MRQARETRGGRLAAGVRKRDSQSALARPVRQDLPREGGSSEIDPKIAEGTTIKTLAAARSGEMEKVKDELKAMLPMLKPSEVRRLLFFINKRSILYFFPSIANV